MNTVSSWGVTVKVCLYAFSVPRLLHRSKYHNWCSPCNRSKSDKFVVQAQLPPVLLSIYSVCLDSLFDLLQGAVESTTPWYNLILHVSERTERNGRRAISAVAGWSWKVWQLTIISHGQHGNVRQDKLFQRDQVVMTAATRTSRYLQLMFAGTTVADEETEYQQLWIQCPCHLSEYPCLSCRLDK